MEVHAMAWAIVTCLCVKGRGTSIKVNKLINSLTFFMISEIHIGNIIKQKLRQQERSNAWLARKLFMDSSNVSKMLKRQYIDTELLLRISIILEEDFFVYYSYVYSQNKNADICQEK